MRRTKEMKIVFVTSIIISVVILMIALSYHTIYIAHDVKYFYENDISRKLCYTPRSVKFECVDVDSSGNIYVSTNYNSIYKVTDGRLSAEYYGVNYSFATVDFFVNEHDRLVIHFPGGAGDDNLNYEYDSEGKLIGTHKYAENEFRYASDICSVDNGVKYQVSDYNIVRYESDGSLTVLYQSYLGSWVLIILALLSMLIAQRSFLFYIKRGEYINGSPKALTALTIGLFTGENIINVCAAFGLYFGTERVCASFLNNYFLMFVLVFIIIKVVSFVVFILLHKQIVKCFIPSDNALRR